jgi:hypothetical protein
MDDTHTIPVRVNVCVISHMLCFLMCYVFAARAGCGLTDGLRPAPRKGLSMYHEAFRGPLCTNGSNTSLFLVRK